jgi:hypothetical protein
MREWITLFFAAFFGCLAGDIVFSLIYHAL